MKSKNGFSVSQPAPLQNQKPQSPLRGVEKIMLSHYRCYDHFSLGLDTRPVVMTGPNGAGKTNLLEAISFLIPGRGLRRARLADVRRQGSLDPWAISVSLKEEGEGIHVGTGLDPENPDSERRIVRINGEKAKSQSTLAEWVSIVWLTPQMDRLFLDGPQGRRQFLDRLVYGFDAAHAQRLNRYEKALRERSFLLRQGRLDRHWLEGLEQTLVSEGIAITAARREVVGQLTAVLKTYEGPFPQADISLEGDIESALREKKVLEVEDQFRARLAESRDQDRFSQRPLYGPHRSDLDVTFTEKNQKAALCSTGEQKALLLSIVMASAQLLAVRTGAIPLLLLDEVVAHLDEARRSALFDAILRLKIQAWLTGTDPSLFKKMQGDAQFLSLEGARLVSIT